jgi:hypothetical protein
MTQGVKDLISAIVEGDAATIDAAFNAEMATRVSSKLEDMRVSVAQNMFHVEQVEESVEEEQIDEELVFEEFADEDVATIIQALSEEEFNEELSEDDEISLTEKYIGFAKLKGQLARKPGVKNPAAVAAAIGRKKYGKEKFQKMAAAGKKTETESWKK